VFFTSKAAKPIACWHVLALISIRRRKFVSTCLIEYINSAVVGLLALVCLDLGSRLISSQFFAQLFSLFGKKG
jgi:hypothetical protein